MLRSDYEGQICSIARSLELVGERWTLLVIRDVFRGKRRFDEIQQSLGIARNVLTSRLERLVEEDILERRLYSEKPKRYEYFLTEKGLDLWPVLVTLMH
ncbi:MAG: winged helix-turn-helix transcriptional regulator [Solirubrobacterales bacterium]